MKHISHDNVAVALARLFPIALADTHQSRHIADFLLAWWDGAVCGNFPISALFNLDRTVADDIVIVLGFVGQRGAIYADAWGYHPAVMQLIHLWRPLVAIDEAA